MGHLLRIGIICSLCLMFLNILLIIRNVLNPISRICILSLKYQWILKHHSQINTSKLLHVILHHISIHNYKHIHINVSRVYNYQYIASNKPTKTRSSLTLVEDFECKS